VGIVCSINEGLEYSTAFSRRQKNVSEKAESCPLLPFEFFYNATVKAGAARPANAFVALFTLSTITNKQ
jgi:hypothetical protein